MIEDARLIYTPPSANCGQLRSYSGAHVEEDLGDLVGISHRR